MDRLKKALCRALSMFYRRLALQWAGLNAQPRQSEGFQRSFLVLPGLLRCGSRVRLELDKAMNLPLAVIQRHGSRFGYKHEPRQQRCLPLFFRSCRETL